MVKFLKNKETNSNKGTDSNNEADKDSKYPTKLPQTGANDIILDIAIVILLILAISFGIKLRAINKRMKK